MDVTEHLTPEGKLYLTVVLDAWEQAGGGMVDRRSHPLRTRRLRSADGRLAQAPAEGPDGGPLRPRFDLRIVGPWPALAGCGAAWLDGNGGDCFDNSVGESFFGTLQLERLDEHRWERRQHVPLAMFGWIESWYNPQRRHGYCKMLSRTICDRPSTTSQPLDVPATRLAPV